jgi:UDP-N-acetylglucosamine transferase subunit ALG13
MKSTAQRIQTYVHTPTLVISIGGGGLLHVDMFAHNKSGIAYHDRNRRSETVVNHKREPHQQPRLLPSCTNCAPLVPGVPIEHLMQARPASNTKCICR